MSRGYVNHQSGLAYDVEWQLHGVYRSATFNVGVLGFVVTALSNSARRLRGAPFGSLPAIAFSAVGANAYLGWNTKNDSNSAVAVFFSMPASIRVSSSCSALAV